MNRQDNLIHYDDSEHDLDELLENNEHVLLDFYADWCGPCKVMESTVKEVAEENEDTLLVVKIDVDEYPRITQSYEVRGVPNFVMVVNEEVTENVVGATEKENLTAPFN